MGKKTIAVAISAAVLAIASPAFAAGWSNVDGGVSGNAGFSGVGGAGVSAAYNGGAGSMSPHGYTTVDMNGGINTFTMGHGLGSTSAQANSGGYANEGHDYANSGSYSQASSYASSYGGVFSTVSAGAGAGASAGHGFTMAPPAP